MRGAAIKKILPPNPCSNARMVEMAPAVALVPMVQGVIGPTKGAEAPHRSWTFKIYTGNEQRRI